MFRPTSGRCGNHWHFAAPTEAKRGRPGWPEKASSQPANSEQCTCLKWKRLTNFPNWTTPFVHWTSDSLFLVVQWPVGDGPHIQTVHDGQDANQRDQKSGGFWDNIVAVNHANGAGDHQTAQSEDDDL